MLEKDAKNYHAWTIRQWALKFFGLWDNELEYVDKLLNLDVRNNSAWNQRFFVIESTTGYTNEVLKAEIIYTQEKLKRGSNNTSAWNYLRGLAKVSSYNELPEIEEFCVEKLESTWGITCGQLYVTLIDIYTKSGDHEKLATAIEYCEKLQSGLDDIHKKYWIYRKTTLEKLIA
eukprot:TRINITY_DN2244_c0_g1_i2.p1 TRINITY_DN2244_c0_g1~~TRINITY_DN2244_c0_g1_i2.p1  ORF type:complete len:174 (+),score=44.17 TRINITY_DN2244_c0_g1_i2:478-999(+)